VARISVVHPPGRVQHSFRTQRLFQQYVVDAAATYDQNRLNWVYHNQSTIRADQYQGLADAFDATDGNPTALGRTLIIPSSHTGSQRSMHAAYMDAMAITGHFRKPHLFLTMTANPEWEEVVQAMRGLSASQQAMNRPDLVTRVFDMKKKQLMREIFYDAFWPHLYLILASTMPPSKRARGKQRLNRQGISRPNAEGQPGSTEPPRTHKLLAGVDSFFADGMRYPPSHSIWLRVRGGTKHSQARLKLLANSSLPENTS
jgi:hypothetical protein